LKTVLKYELAAMPPSLFHDDGTMRKCAKSELAKKLEACCEEVLELPLNIQTTRNTAYIFDGMATLQALNDSCFKTFNDLAEIIVKRLIRKLQNSDVDVVALVFDRYDVDLSIKTGERQHRGANPESASTYQIIQNRPMPNYRQFLKGVASKLLLMTLS